MLWIESDILQLNKDSDERSVDMKRTKEEKVIRLLQYLKQYTDRYNPTSISRIVKYFDEQYEENYFGDRHTRQKMIQEIVRVINSDADGNILPKEEWRVIYDDFDTIHGKGVELDKRHQIVNLYYNQEFNNDDIRMLIRSVEKNDELNSEDKDSLLQKINQCLKNEYYGQRGMAPAMRTTRERIKKEKDARRKVMMQQKLQRDGEW